MDRVVGLVYIAWADALTIHHFSLQLNKVHYVCISRRIVTILNADIYAGIINMRRNPYNSNPWHKSLSNQKMDTGKAWEQSPLH